ncbi:hypothetical protein [Streptomyces sp. NPDC059452]|uniref:hypothetical protein n=1 Tax=Streptomyces sp. NPDC059452 TaxID=3346835 RepID=UPI0036773A83
MSGDGGGQGRSANHHIPPPDHRGTEDYGTGNPNTRGSNTGNPGTGSSDTRDFDTGSSNIWGSVEPHGRKPGGGGAERDGHLSALTRSWVTGALVYLAAGFLMSRLLLELLGSQARLETFGGRLSLLHIPALAVTLLTVLAAARTLPDEYRKSRTLYLLAVLTVPLAGLAYGFAVPSEAVGIEAVLMPVVSLATGATSGVAVDRLLEERATRPPPPPTYSYNWRDRGATSTVYPGLVVLVLLVVLIALTLIGALAMAGRAVS